MKLSVATMKKQFNKLCDPSQFYLVLSLVSLIVYLLNMFDHDDKANTVIGIVIQFVVVLVWTCVLNWVCSFKHGSKISWFLVFLPLIMTIGLLLVIYHLIDKLGLTKEDIMDMVESGNLDKLNELSNEADDDSELEELY